VSGQGGGDRTLADPALTGLQTGTVTARVPATSANLGPGFDSFGLALARYDEVSACATEGGLLVEVDGMGAGEVPLTDEHLVVRAIARAFAAVDKPVPGLHLRCRNTIAHGGGLGSSAAAIVAGLLLGRELARSSSATGPRGPAAAPAGELLTDADLLALATEMEGHPDNVAPALLGGFTVAVSDPAGRPVVARLAVHPDVRVVVFTAHRSSSTRHSRGLLPASVPHADAAANAASAGLLVHALTTEPSYLLLATRDRLHQHYRASAMPESARLLDDLRAAGIAAVISGAGPSVLALVTGPMELARWQRPCFDVAEITVCASGAQLIGP
jgi:homoserine kinase